jgi:hypothetical protein
LRELFDYNPESGLLSWRVRPECGKAWNAKYAGTPAGTKQRAGLGVALAYRKYGAHVIIWAWMTGEWPATSIDHKDRNQYNNAWHNLRLATPAQQCQNRSRTTSLPKGVRRSRNRYVAILGSFATPEEAHEAWLLAAPSIHGDFFSSD